jgi:CTP synthase (UTP-ammonia lyase)
MSVAIEPGTVASRCYDSGCAEESYYCNFGLNPDYRSALVEAGLTVSGTDQSGEVRIIELPSHPFYMGTLFVPQMRGRHRLIAEFYRVAALR